jgi:Ca-activated chloride channel family protein
MKRWLMLLTAVLGLTTPCFADGLIIIHDPPIWHPPARPPHPPRPWPVPPPRVYKFAPLEILSHHVTVKIDGQIARTHVDQEFHNPNDQRLEGTYLFPVPKGGQLDKFTMEIGGQQVEAELLPADKARQIYEDIVRRMKDPALLEYADRDTFKVRIFPIEPRGNKRITLSYTQVLRADHGLVGYLYPLNTTRFSAAPIKSLSLKIELDARRPLKTIYSPSHTVETKRHGDARAIIGFEGRDVQPDTDFQLFWSSDEKDIGVSLLTHKPADQDGYFLLLAAPGPTDKPGHAVLPKDVAIVLDTSGSMAGAKLQQAKKALLFCVENLNDADRFEIIRFSTETEPLFGKLLQATDAHRQRAADFIKDLRPIGGTAIEEALVTALKLRPDQPDRPYLIIFITDGQPTIGNTREQDILDSVRKTDPGKTRVFCFGVGTDVNTHLLDKIAEHTRAFTQYVLPEEDIEVKVSNFFTRIKEPVLADPLLSATGDIRLGKFYPSPLPDLFRGDQLIVAGRYSGSGPAAVVIEGTVAGQTRRLTWDVTFADRADDHDFIPRLWAARRIGHLLDEIRLRGENKELRDEIAELARHYGIVTPYTAYLIVEDEKQRGVPPAARALPQFERDTPTRLGAAEAYSTLRSETTGAPGVTAARAAAAMKSAPGSDAFAPGGDAHREAQRAFTEAGPTGADLAARMQLYSQQTRFLNGRAFYLNDNRWIDATVQNLPHAPRVPVKFASDEYFALLAQHPEAAPWLSLGPNLHLALAGNIYEITE